MARDYAKKGRTAPARKRSASRNSGKPASSGAAGWRWYFAGVLTGLFLSSLLYLGTLAPGGSSVDQDAQAAADQVEEPPPAPRFDFYTLLPEQEIEVDVEPPVTQAQPASSSREYYLLQAGSFRQREDADRRRAELLLLGLEPSIEETSGENGRWFRVYLGPFDSRSKMSRARSLTAAQNIDTLLLKRSG